MARVWQEFYCNDCDGYIDVKINISINQDVLVKCPNCGREHPRTIKNGVIYERGQYESRYCEKITPVKAAYHKDPKTIRMKTQETTCYSRRDGVTVESPRDLINESWFERYGNKVKQE